MFCQLSARFSLSFRSVQKEPHCTEEPLKDILLLYCTPRQLTITTKQPTIAARLLIIASRQLTTTNKRPKTSNKCHKTIDKCHRTPNKFHKTTNSSYLMLRCTGNAIKRPTNKQQFGVISFCWRNNLLS